MSFSGKHGLSYTSTVSRQLVHRAAICEVFLTDTRRRSDSDFLIAAQLPRVHSYYSDHLGTPAAYDPLLLLEVFRQTSILVAHEHLGVPLGAKFSFNTGEFTVLDTAALEIGPLPGHALLTASVTAEKRRGDERVGVTLEMRLAVDDRAAAAMTMAIQWMPGEAWDRLRARGRAGLDLDTPRALPHPGGRRLPPAAVGRRSSWGIWVGNEGVAGFCLHDHGGCHGPCRGSRPPSGSRGRTRRRAAAASRRRGSRRSGRPRAGPPKCRPGS